MEAQFATRYFVLYVGWTRDCIPSYDRSPETTERIHGLGRLRPQDSRTNAEKTGRAMIVHEDVKTLGIGAELAAVIVEERFAYLDAPVIRVTYPDTHCPFSQVLEQANLPNADTIATALRQLLAY